MNRRTKTLQIPESVKEAVWNRDGGKCVLCGQAWTAAPNAHFIGRAQGGMGIEKNVVTLCAGCHRLYDQSPHRTALRMEIEAYLRHTYQDWNEEELYYRKGDKQ